jgi:hypothetical protein
MEKAIGEEVRSLLTIRKTAEDDDDDKKSVAVRLTS